MLASDAERESTVERLRVAVADGRLTMDELSDRSEIAYRARTGAELAALTRDLPPIGAVSLARGPVIVAGEEDRGDTYIAVFSGSERKGHWRVPRRSRAVAVFGGIELDMSGAEFAAREVTVVVVAVFGGVVLTVPDGVEVRMTGVAIFGGKSVKVPPARAGAPVIHVRCTAVFAGVEVTVATGGSAAVVPDAPTPPPPPPAPWTPCSGHR